MTVPLTLSTARLQLRLPKLTDAAAVFEYASDPLVARYMDWPAAVEPADSLRATERALQKWASGEEHGWRIVVPSSDVPIGGVGRRIRGDAADFGFVLNRNYWRRGYATEAASAVDSHALSAQSAVLTAARAHRLSWR